MSDSNYSLSRRQILVGSAALLASPGLVQATEQTLKFYIGTYSHDDVRGLYPLSYNPGNDQWALGPVLSSIENVSFGVFSSKFGRYYLLNEKAEGEIGIFDREWQAKGSVASQGNAPCYVSLNVAQTHLAVANYMSGDIALYKIASDGGLSNPAVSQNEGHGPDPKRQEGPHAHWVQFAPDQKHIYSVDLGTDQILGYSLNPDRLSDALGERFVAFQAPPGSGPRHLAFHPDGRTAFLVTEMGNEALVLSRGADGRFNLVQSLSTLPSGFSGHSQAAHIVLNQPADRLYISNRGHNSLAVFAVAPDGHLSLLQIVQTTGDWPRFFMLLEKEKRLVIAHQNSNDLIVFTVQADGTIAPRNERLSVPRPVFIGTAA